MDIKKEINTIEELIDSVSYITDKDEINIIKKAYEFACNVHKNNTRLCGEDYMHHPLNVAYNLTKLYADSDTIAAGLLHDTIHIGNSTLDELKKEFSLDICTLVEGITTINNLNLSTDSEDHINYFKKIIVGLTEDVRIIIIKLVERVDNMKTLYILKPEKQKDKAKETLEILVPIAHRLGLSEIKKELEVLSLKYYKPDAFKSVEAMLNNTEEQRNNLLLHMKRRVSELLIDNNIKFEIKARVKSIYSIYNKMQKGKKFSELFDIYGIRIIVNTESECYQVLGIIHSKFKPLQNRFKDYIANPKVNMYRSLHTTVFGYDGKLYEIQIRTHEMDEVAERGIASHWSYKEKGKKMQNSMEEKLQLFRSIIELDNDNISSDEFVNTVKNELLSDNIYVYTPKGDVFELPKEATPIDFAYKVHSKIGETMVGALINDVIAPLDTQLKSNDIVKIITNKNSKPSKEWLLMAKTSQAKNKIKSYFSKIDKNEAIEKGKDLFLKEVRKRKIPISSINDNMKDIISKLKVKDENEMYYNFGTGNFSVKITLNSIFKDELEKEDFMLDKINNKNIDENDYKNDFIVGNIDNVKVSTAKCCYPIKGDEIIGYITRGNGIVVHSKNCKNLNLLEDRFIDIKWNKKVDKKYDCLLNITTIKKDNILIDIINKASSLNISIVKINTINNLDNIMYEISIKVSDIDTLKKYKNTLNQNKDIIKIERVFN